MDIRWGGVRVISLLVEFLGSQFLIPVLLLVASGAAVFAHREMKS